MAKIIIKKGVIKYIQEVNTPLGETTVTMTLEEGKLPKPLLIESIRFIRHDKHVYGIELGILNQVEEEKTEVEEVKIPRGKRTGRSLRGLIYTVTETDRSYILERVKPAKKGGLLVKHRYVLSKKWINKALDVIGRNFNFGEKLDIKKFKELMARKYKMPKYNSWVYMVLVVLDAYGYIRYDSRGEPRVQRW